MKSKFFISASIVLLTIGLLSIYSCQKSPEKTKNNEELVVDISPKHGVTFIGTEKDIKEGKKAMDDLVDPAYDIALNARDLYKEGEYTEAEKEAFRAIKEAKHGIVRHSAHNTLLKIYEKIGKYDLAIKEIDILLSHVNEYAKKELLKRKEKLQKLLQEQQK